ncbi:YfbK domain-containing protein [Pedobacter deserti]|uniref:YfbK domain-containing protein n=1 Tax=Pedobacter deserti TaxID=2817382 RepID=UPI00210AECD2|nr:von Willebrand factor type A domain-containing protein [Pedobacter sp. SYSU D00382]
MKNLFLPAIIIMLFTAFKVRGDWQTISGTVTSAQDNRGLENARISYVVPGDQPKLAGHTDRTGKYQIKIPKTATQLVIEHMSYNTKTVSIIGSTSVDVVLSTSRVTNSEAVIRGHSKVRDVPVANIPQLLQGKVAGLNIQNGGYQSESESYATINESGFRSPTRQPLSTFSADVDVASYSNMRRFLNNGSLPPADAVRIEEMINYFDYAYEQPKGGNPLNIHTEISSAPWNTNHKLVRIGLQGKKVETGNLPESNLVFLIDVSGSMNAYNKLPLLVSSLKMLTDQLRASDKVAIVVYAGSAGVVLPSTPGSQKMKIKQALSQLTAGGSTAGGRGIELAYNIASEHFIKGGNNRVILATDGDFNVGPSSDGDMLKLIERKHNTGISLTVLGYGMGNLKDSKMELLADKGNGNYAYIDNINEARKVLVNAFGGTMFTIAKDVKLQVEFNPSRVQAYRLIGYENRKLKAGDFNDDRKDAGDIGAGHQVTALYEIIPAGVKSSFAESVDPLKYQQKDKPAVYSNSRELMTVKVRYKKPDGGTSKMIKKAVLDIPVSFARTSEDFKFNASIAEFGMLLRQSPYKQNASFEQAIRNASAGLGKDPEGYRSEFVRLVKSAKLLAKDLLVLERTDEIDEKN